MRELRPFLIRAAKKYVKSHMFDPDCTISDETTNTVVSVSIYLPNIAVYVVARDYDKSKQNTTLNNGDFARIRTFFDHKKNISKQKFVIITHTEHERLRYQTGYIIIIPYEVIQNEFKQKRTINIGVTAVQKKFWSSMGIRYEQLNKSPWNINNSMSPYNKKLANGWTNLCFELVKKKKKSYLITEFPKFVGFYLDHLQLQGSST